MIFCSLFNPAIDVSYSLDSFPVGSTLVDQPAVVYPSGKGLNVARVIKTLGEDVMVIGIVPTLDIPRFESFCYSQQIDYEFVKTTGGARINTTISDRSSGVITHINSRAGDCPERVQHECVGEMVRRMQKNDFWIFSGSVPEQFDETIYATLVRQCRQAQALSLLDSRGLSFKLGVRACPTMVKPNLSELEAFFGEPVQGVRHIALKGKRLIDLGIPWVFVSLGADGMIALHENDCLLCSVPRSVAAIDTVGCGDALVAGITVGTLRNFSFHETCRLAIACASSNAMHQGPGVVDREEIWRLMEETTIEAV